MLKRHSLFYGYAFTLPALFFIFFFMLYPVIEAFRLSFFEWDGLSPAKFIGLKNYINLFTKDTVFSLAVRNSFLFMLITVIGIVGIGFILAVIIERRVRGWGFFKVVWFIPAMISQTIVSILWAKFLDPTMGIVSKILSLLGMNFLIQSWLGNSKIVMYIVSLVSIWQYAGLAMVLLLVPMENIPIEIHEAATIDGVNIIQRVTRIIFPLIKPVFYIVVMLVIIGSLKTFDTIFVLTGGGPGDASIVLPIYVYKAAIKYYAFGYGSTVSVIMFLIIFTISIIYSKFLKI